MPIRKLKPISAKFITGAAMLALIAGASPVGVQSAYADDCLLDTNNDGNADNNSDTDLGADSGGVNDRLACGFDATATGERSTALGSNTSATGTGSTALGYVARAAGIRSTALGYAANNAGAAGDYSISIGNLSTARGTNAIAIGADSIDGDFLGANAQGTDSIAIGADAIAAGGGSTALGTGASAAGTGSTALGRFARAAGLNSTALGRSASAGGTSSTALGRLASAAGDFSTAVGLGAETDLDGTTSVGYAANLGITVGANSTALGYYAKTGGTNAIAIGADTADGGLLGADAQGDNSIVIGADASDSNNVGAIVIGKGATATEADQIILKSADIFTILGNGDVGIGTAAPLANLDINSGAADTTLLLNNTSAQWELKSKASTGRLNFKNLTDGGVPFKLGPSAVNSLLSVGTMADDLVEVRGELMVEGNVDVTGTLTTGGPTCGGGCDAVFGADYDLPTIEEHARAMYANSYLPQVGPTVPHAPMNISETMGDMLNELEKAHIYIAQMNEQHKAEMALMQQQITTLMNK